MEYSELFKAEYILNNKHAMQTIDTASETPNAYSFIFHFHQM